MIGSFGSMTGRMWQSKQRVHPPPPQHTHTHSFCTLKYAHYVIILETVLHLHAIVNTSLQTDQSQSWLSQQCHTHVRLSFNQHILSISSALEYSPLKNLPPPPPKKERKKKVEICGTIIKSQLVSWCFEPSQPQRITSGLNTNFVLSPKLFISQVRIPQEIFFLVCLYSAGTQHGNLHPAG